MPSNFTVTGSTILYARKHDFKGALITIYEFIIIEVFRRSVLKNWGK